MLLIAPMIAHRLSLSKDVDVLMDSSAKMSSFYRRVVNHAIQLQIFIARPAPYRLRFGKGLAHRPRKQSELFGRRSPETELEVKRLSQWSRKDNGPVSSGAALPIGWIAYLPIDSRLSPPKGGGKVVK